MNKYIEEAHLFLEMAHNKGVFTQDMIIGFLYLDPDDKANQQCFAELHKQYCRTWLPSIQKYDPDCHLIWYLPKDELRIEPLTYYCAIQSGDFIYDYMGVHTLRIFETLNEITHPKLKRFTELLRPHPYFSWASEKHADEEPKPSDVSLPFNSLSYLCGLTFENHQTHTFENHQTSSTDDFQRIILLSKEENEALQPMVSSPHFYDNSHPLNESEDYSVFFTEAHSLPGREDLSLLVYNCPLEKLEALPQESLDHQYFKATLGLNKQLLSRPSSETLTFFLKNSYSHDLEALHVTLKSKEDLNCFKTWLTCHLMQSLRPTRFISSPYRNKDGAFEVEALSLPMVFDALENNPKQWMTDKLPILDALKNITQEAQLQKKLIAPHKKPSPFTPGRF